MNTLVGLSPSDMDRVVRRQATLSLLGPVMISPTMASNLFTMGASAVKDPRQAIPTSLYTMPGSTTRMVRARLIFEETLEKLKGLGFAVTCADAIEIKSVDDVQLHEKYEPNLWDIIDACIDGNYVNTGTLAACGVPDTPHLHIVNEANDAKFPGGVATIDGHGKYQKPPGWKAPDHERVADAIKKAYDSGVMKSLYIQSQALLAAERPAA